MSLESKLRWQCRRGMRELDTLLSGYLEQRYADSSEAQKDAFHRLLELSDPELIAYLLGGDEPQDPELKRVVDGILLRS